MKAHRILSALLIPILFFSGCSLASQEGPEAKIESRKEEKSETRVEVPDFTLKNLNGEEVRLSAFRNVSPVLLVFWATWCPYCREEMPTLNDLKDQYKKDLEILAIDIQESQAKVASFAKNVGYNFQILLDQDGLVANDYGVVGVPTFVLIDREGMGALADNRLSQRMRQAIAEVIQ